MPQTTLTPTLCRAARALLDLTQDQLAELAHLSVRTLKAFEKGTPPVSADSETAITDALVDESIEFVSRRDGRIGVLVRPKPKKAHR
ncbi:helix-turn-helix domain-containing protein [Azospirillum sp. sgz302134]